MKIRENIEKRQESLLETLKTDFKTEDCALKKIYHKCLFIFSQLKRYEQRFYS